VFPSDEEECANVCACVRECVCECARVGIACTSHRPSTGRFMTPSRKPHATSSPLDSDRNGTAGRTPCGRDVEPSSQMIYYS
jgi:hypothetical protein